MKGLLDVGISPRLRLPLQELLDGAPVESAVFHQWRALRDAELLERAVNQGFTAVVTTDKRMASEQPQSSISIVAIDDNRIGALISALPAIANAILSARAGEHLVVAAARR